MVSEPSAVTYGTIHKRTPRSFARRIVLDLLSIYYALSGKTRRALKKNRVQFLYFHHVFRDEEKPFRNMLAELARHHQFLGYSEAVEKIVSGKIDKPYLCVSFDDGIDNCLQASKIMDDLSIKGCFFVCPPMLDEKDPEKLAAFSHTIAMPPLKYLSWQDVNDMLKRGHEIGGHTMTHFNLGEASASHLADEVGGSYESLRKVLTGKIHFAWPFGMFKHFSAAAGKAVFDYGYATCASAERGCHMNRIEDRRNLCLRRDHVLAVWPIRHLNYFMARNVERARTVSGTWPEQLKFS